MYLRTMMDYRSISDGLPAVSRLGLGSWHTFVRMTFEDIVELFRRALEGGVNFFDVGTYRDQPFNEVVVGRVLRELAVRRETIVIAGKPEFGQYPLKSFAEQVETSLRRIETDYLDLFLVSNPGPDVDFARACEELSALVSDGRVRAWGAINWTADRLAEAHRLLTMQGLSPPRLVQLQYNPGRRDAVESIQSSASLARASISICASNVLEGGILTGRRTGEDIDRSGDRPICRDLSGRRDAIRSCRSDFAAIASGFGLTAAQAALLFALDRPDVATAVVGITRMADLEDHLRALDFAYVEELRASLLALPF